MGDFVKATQESLGKLIKKPPLTEKLLRKPPFRFLHDIITEVIRTSGFMKGLYSATEMDSQNVKDKESKIAFLQKAIDVVALVNKKPLSVKPSKIVAGHEPEKTNELLQQIASAMSSKMDSSDAVAQVLGGTRNESESSKPPRPAKEDEKIRDSGADKKRRDKENKEKKSSSDNRDRSSSRDREKDRERSKDRDRHRDRGKDKGKDKDSDGSKDREQDRSKDKERKGRDKERNKEQDKEREQDKDRDKDRVRERERSRDKDRDRDKERDRERRERRKRKEEETIHQQQNGHHKDEEPEDGASINRIPRPTSAKGQRRRPLQGSDDNDGQKAGQDERTEMVNGSSSLAAQVQASRKLARPSSARPAPPRVKKEDAAEESAMRIGSGKQVSSVIVDNGQNSEDEDDTFVVEESQLTVNDEPQVMGSESLEEDGEHGGLVKKILETKKELEGSKAADKKDDKPIVIDGARRKERERVQREVEKLTSAIQTLTRSANPLGKIMDYLQEDVDSMQKELEMWKKENQEHKLAIKREQGITDTELEPLKAQLTELDQGIQDQLDTIATIKSNLLRGDEKIAKMVSTVAIS